MKKLITIFRGGVCLAALLMSYFLFQLNFLTFSVIIGLCAIVQIGTFISATHNTTHMIYADVWLAVSVFISAYFIIGGDIDALILKKVVIEQQYLNFNGIFQDWIGTSNALIGYVDIDSINIYTSSKFLVFVIWMIYPVVTLGILISVATIYLIQNVFKRDE